MSELRARHDSKGYPAGDEPTRRGKGRFEGRPVRRVRADRSKAGHDPEREREGAKGGKRVRPNATHARDRMRSVTETRTRGVERRVGLTRQ